VNTTVSSKKQKGFSLVEVILAVGMLAVAILVLVGLVGAAFTQLESIIQTNRALAVVSAVNASLDAPELVGGARIPNATNTNTPKFKAVYDFVKTAVDGQKVILYHFNTEINNSAGGKSIIAVVYRSASGTFTKAEYDEQNGVGPVFRVEMSISKLLENNRIEFDESTAAPTDAIYTGGPIPSNVNFYALAFIPLYLEIYAHDFGGSADQAALVQPILSQNIIINR
jgi:Tfp pilus assembly protein PilV